MATEDQRLIMRFSREDGSFKEVVLLHRVGTHWETGMNDSIRNDEFEKVLNEKLPEEYPEGLIFYYATGRDYWIDPSLSATHEVK